MCRLLHIIIVATITKATTSLEWKGKLFIFKPISKNKENIKMKLTIIRICWVAVICSTSRAAMPETMEIKGNSKILQYFQQPGKHLQLNRKTTVN